MQLKRPRNAIIGAVVAFLLLFAYAVSSVLYWQQYAQATERHMDAQTSLEKALNKDASTATQKQDKLVALEEAGKQLLSSSTACQPSWWVAWQQKLASPGQLTSECREVAAGQVSMRTALVRMQSYVKNEAALGSALSPLAILPAKLTDKTWPKTIAIWQEVEQEIEKIPADENFQATKKEVSNKIKAVVSAWKALAEANKKEETTAYTNAHDKLDSAISDLQDIADISDKRLSMLIKQLQTTVDTAN